MIRTFKAEDVDYIIHSHYQLYNREFGYDLSFKNFIAESVNRFIERSSAEENIWILELNGEQKGSISIKIVNERTAQLGLFLVDPSIRGGGWGKKLVEQAIRFCRSLNVQEVMLLTNKELEAARKIYERSGFKLMETWVENKSNKDLVEEKWVLAL
ncbi:GNAT family N-acetyltransferase [Shouchella shacheensis]|uniref:GNAT family N-acetyltransferase n=1 Tax=Shouchella shacheensis TaxID=1649580 RepID=UPI00073FFB75|nr:GNAT family N-acetyltransferase [Shouchella shacheensis]